MPIKKPHPPKAVRKCGSKPDANAKPSGRNGAAPPRGLCCRGRYAPEDAVSCYFNIAYVSLREPNLWLAGPFCSWQRSPNGPIRRLPSRGYLNLPGQFDAKCCKTAYLNHPTTVSSNRENGRVLSKRGAFNLPMVVELDRPRRWRKPFPPAKPKIPRQSSPRISSRPGIYCMVGPFLFWLWGSAAVAAWM